MGLFYTTLYIGCSDIPFITRILQEQPGRSYIIPPQKQYVIVYNELLCGRKTVFLQRFLKHITNQLDCLCFVVINIDDDQLECFGHTPTEHISLEAEQLARTFNKQKQLSKLHTLLSTSFVFASEQHKHLAQALNLPFKHSQYTFAEILQLDIELGNNEYFKIRTLNTQMLRLLADNDSTQKQSVEQEVRRLIHQGKIISAISRYQQSKGCTLTEARRYVEQLRHAKTAKK